MNQAIKAFVAGILFVALSSYALAAQCIGTGPDVDNYIGKLRDQNSNALPGKIIKAYLCDIGMPYGDQSCTQKASATTEDDAGFEGFYQIDINGVIGCDEGKPLYLVVGQEIVLTANWTGSKISDGTDDLVAFIESPSNKGGTGSGNAGGSGSGGGGSGNTGTGDSPGKAAPQDPCKPNYSCKDIGACNNGIKTIHCEDTYCGEPSYERTVKCTPEKPQKDAAEEKPAASLAQETLQKLPEPFRNFITGRFFFEGAGGDKDTFTIAVILLILIAITAYYFYQQHDSFLRKL